MEDCLFCKIIKKETSSNIVYENEWVLAFSDIHPVAPIHILIVPKIHISNLNEINEKNSTYISQVYLAIKEVAHMCNIDETGYRVICNCGSDGVQVIQHLHFHLLGGRHLGSKIVKD
ncbi:MAG: histidine triad nucleotide-binding protein [Clostridia bacterium]